MGEGNDIGAKPPTPAAKTPRSERAALIAAVVMALAGNADWFKARDDSATRASYEATAAALERLADDIEDDLDALEEQRERDIEWVAKRLRAVDRDMLPEDVRSRTRMLPPTQVAPDTPEPADSADRPPPPPKPKRADAAQRPKMPAFGELAK